MIYDDMIRPKIVHAQTVIEADKLNALKERTGEHSTKDAVYKAIDHYLECKDVKLKEVKGKGKDNANFRTTN